VTDDTFEPKEDGAAAPAEGAGDPVVGESTAVEGRPTVGVAWLEGTPGHWVIKLSGLQGAPPGEEVALGRSGANNHSPSISNHLSAAGDILGFSVAWIESPAGDTSGVGRVLWQRFSAGAGGKPIDAAALAVAANDNATWVTDPSGTGVIGCEPAVTGLTTGDTLVTWIGADGHAHGRLYAPVDASPAGEGSDAPEYATVNAVLGDLGPIAAATDAGRRMQIAELRPGTFAVMWLALAENGPVLRGSLFLAPVNAERIEDRGGDWTEYPISEVRLPHGFTGQFSMAVGGEGGEDLLATYSLTSGGSGAEVVARLSDIGWAEGRAGQSAAEQPSSVGDGVGTATLRVAPGQDDEVQPHELVAANALQAATVQVHDAAEAHAAAAFTIAADPLIEETAPIVKAVKGGFAVAWQTPGDAGQAVQIKLVLYDEQGTAKSPEILVTDNAAPDVAPAIAGLGDGVAAAFVHADDRALVVSAYGGDGGRLGEETVVDAGDSGPIVEIAVGSNAQDEFAVVYVQQYSDFTGDLAGYGNIMLQRYAVQTQGDHSQLAALGRDGEQDGADGPVQLTVEVDDSAAAQVAVGRAPSVTGVDDGELAIVWVESDGVRETIAGCVLDPGGGQVLRIDLTGLLESAGIAKGSKPALLDTPDGDLLVSWLQADGGAGGYVVMAALYAQASPGAWLEPEQAIRLKAFDSEPEDYSVAVSSDEDGLSINVIWQQDGGGQSGGDRVYSQRYDVEGSRSGSAVRIDEDDMPAGEQQLSTSTLAAAGLLDGQIIVVYAQQGSDGDLDLAAHIIDTGAAGGIYGDDQTYNDVYRASDNTFSTGVDQEATIDVLVNKIGAGLTISHIDDVPITTATPVDVGHGWVQLREDGLLTVSPDAGFTGQIAFDCTVAGTTDDSESRVILNVEASNEESTALTLRNRVITVPEDLSTAGDLKVADISMSHGGLDTDGLSLTGLDASMFKIVGNALYLKEGIELDFETKPTLSVEILASQAYGYDGAANFTLNIGNAAETAGLDDTFVFVPSYGESSGEHDVIDLRSAGYATFQELLDSGALAQAGDDVVITLDPDDPASAHKITLRGVELSALSDSDFRFS